MRRVNLEGQPSTDSAELIYMDLEVRNQILTRNLPSSYSGYVQVSGPELPFLIDRA